MKNALDFIRFALSHAKLESIPLGAKLPLDIDECGTEEWEYLPGMKGEQVTDELIEAKYENFYKLFGWTRERFDHVTTNFARKRVHACDSQGLLTAYTGMEATPNYCYSAWCTEKGRIGEVKRPYAIGEAVFIMDSEERMMHTGFICGQLGGEPLVVEARGIAFGVCVTKLSERPWTHRGLCTRRLIYDENCYDEQIVLSLQKPRVRGEAVKMLQQALNALGYFAGDADGVCGEFTLSAVKEFSKAHLARLK